MTAKQLVLLHVVGFLSLVLGLTLLVTPAPAQVQPVILCNSADEVEGVYTAYAEGIPLQEVIEANNKNQGGNSCGIATVEASVVENVRLINVKGDTFVIIKVYITAVEYYGKLRPVDGLIQYGLMPLRKGLDS